MALLKIKGTFVMVIVCSCVIFIHKSLMSNLTKINKRANGEKSNNSAASQIDYTIHIDNPVLIENGNKSISSLPEQEEIKDVQIVPINEFVESHEPTLQNNEVQANEVNFILIKNKNENNPKKKIPVYFWIIVALFLLCVILTTVLITKSCSSTDRYQDEESDTIYLDKEITNSENQYVSKNNYSPSNDIDNELERWDSRNYVYSNFKYGFSIDLPSDIFWQKTSGTSKHTIFKVVQPDTEMVMFVNVFDYRETGKELDDIWVFENEFKTIILPESRNLVSDNSQEKIVSQNIEKCVFSGRHAFKITAKSTLDDDRYSSPVSMSTYDYTFMRSNMMYTVSLKCYSDIEEHLQNEGIDIKSLFKGFSLI